MKLKVLFHINAIGFGGSGRVITNLANSFALRGYDVVFVISWESETDYPLVNKIRKIALEKNNEIRKCALSRNVYRIRKLREILKSEKPDIALSFLPETNMRLLVAAIGLKIKTCVSIRGNPNMEYNNFIKKTASRFLYPGASKIIFQTNEQKRFFHHKIQNKSLIIPNQLDESFFKYINRGRRKHIVSVGRLEKVKNHSIIIEAFSKIACDYPLENLYIYGEGSLKTILNKQIEALKLKDRAFIMQPTHNLQDKIGNAKLFILSSFSEGMPNALLEAMALGIPIITSNCCEFVKELSNNGNTYAVFEKGNINQLVYEMKRILSDESTQIKISESERAKSLEFSPEKVFLKWEKAFCSLFESNN